MAGKKKRAPWLDLFDGMGPVERLFERNDPVHGEAAEKDAAAELHRRAACLAEHLGADTYREAYLALLATLHSAFTVVDPPPPRTDKTAAKMRGGAGLALLHHVAVVGEDLRDKKTGKLAKREAVFAELRALAPETYGKQTRDHLRKDFHEAVRHHRKSTKRRAK
jgi:hypothetical protein